MSTLALAAGSGSLSRYGLTDESIVSGPSTAGVGIGVGITAGRPYYSVKTLP